MDLWENIVEHSSLKDVPGTDFWTHVINQVGGSETIFVVDELTGDISTMLTAGIESALLEADFSPHTLSANIEENILTIDLIIQNEATL